MMKYKGRFKLSVVQQYLEGKGGCTALVHRHGLVRSLVRCEPLKGNRALGPAQYDCLENLKAVLLDARCGSLRARPSNDYPQMGLLRKSGRPSIEPAGLVA